MIDFNKFTLDCNAVGTQSPIVLNITNYVAMNFSANALLAFGASPFMSVSADEIVELVRLCNSLVLNIGCIDSGQVQIMRMAADEARLEGKNWVLDPVGAGASRLRRETALELIASYHPSVIRGNASEIVALAIEGNPKSHGVDAAFVGESDAVAAAKSIACKYGSVVSVSGPVDLVTDGEKVETIANGNPLMTKVTAMGCVASALTGAFLAVESDCFASALEAMALMGVCGERAAAKCAGTGSLETLFLDELSNFDAESASASIRQNDIFGQW